MAKSILINIQTCTKSTNSIKRQPSRNELRLNKCCCIYEE